MPGEGAAMVASSGMDGAGPLAVDEREELALPVIRQTVHPVPFPSVIVHIEAGLAAVAASVTIAMALISGHPLPQSGAATKDLRAGVPRALTDRFMDGLGPDLPALTQAGGCVVRRGCPPVMTRCHIAVPAGTHIAAHCPPPAYTRDHGSPSLALEAVSTTAPRYIKQVPPPLRLHWAYILSSA